MWYALLKRDPSKSIPFYTINTLPFFTQPVIKTKMCWENIPCDSESPRQLLSKKVTITKKARSKPPRVVNHPWNPPKYCKGEIHVLCTIPLHNTVVGMRHNLPEDIYFVAKLVLNYGQLQCRQNDVCCFIPKSHVKILPTVFICLAVCIWLSLADRVFEREIKLCQTANGLPSG